VSVPPVCGVLAAGAVVVVVVDVDVVDEVLLQEVSAKAEIRDATSTKLKLKNRISFSLRFLLIPFPGIFLFDVPGRVILQVVSFLSQYLCLLSFITFLLFINSLLPEQQDYFFIVPFLLIYGHTVRCLPSIWGREGLAVRRQTYLLHRR